MWVSLPVNLHSGRTPPCHHLSSPLQGTSLPVNWHSDGSPLPSTGTLVSWPVTRPSSRPPHNLFIISMSPLQGLYSQSPGAAAGLVMHSCVMLSAFSHPPRPRGLSFGNVLPSCLSWNCFIPPPLQPVFGIYLGVLTTPVMSKGVITCFLLPKKHHRCTNN